MYTYVLVTTTATFLLTTHLSGISWFMNTMPESEYVYSYTCQFITIQMN